MASKTNRIFLSFLTLIFLFLSVSISKAEVRLNTIKLPPGFNIDIYAQRVEGARSLAIGPDGVIFAGSRSQGKIYALIDKNSDHRAKEVITVARGLNSPNGVAYHNGSLYVAEISRVLRFDNIGKQLTNPPEPVIVND